MFQRTQFEKLSLPVKEKNKNIENNNKKKKNRNGSPLTQKAMTDRTKRDKQDCLLHVKKTDTTEQRLSKSMEKKVIKAMLQIKQKEDTRKISKKLNNSPAKNETKYSNTAIKKNSHSRSKSKSPSTSRKQTANLLQRTNEELHPLQATKRQLFHTQKKERSPLPKSKIKSKQKEVHYIKEANNKQSKKTEEGKKKIRCVTPIKAKKEVQTIKSQDVKGQQVELQYYLQSKQKPKKVIPQIKTKFSSRKKSYIDQLLLNRLENHLSNKNIDYIESCFLRSIQEDEKNQQNRKQKRNPKSPKDVKIHEKVEILSFKKEQQGKWSMMLQQIKNLKNEAQISQKIDNLITQITQNYNHLQKQIIGGQEPLQENAKEVIHENSMTEMHLYQQLHTYQQNDKTYSNMSNFNLTPSKLQEPLLEVVKEKVIEKEEPRSHMISIQDFFNNSDRKIEKNLKKQLFSFKQTQKQENPQKIESSHIESPKAISIEFNNHIKIVEPSSQFTQTKEITVKMEQSSNTLHPFLHNQQPSKPAQHLFLQVTEIQNSSKEEQIQQIVALVQQNIINKFCTQLINNKRLLHYFLFNFDPQNNPNFKQNQLSFPPQPSCNQYTFHLLQKLLDHLFTNYRNYFFQQISYYYQCKPMQILRYVRSTHQQQDEQLSYEIQNEGEIEIPFFNLDKIYEFQTEALSNEEYQPNYFTFNQCVYDAFNDVFDKLRPYGAKGKSIFTLQLSHSLKTESSIRSSIFSKFHDIFAYEFDEQFLIEDLKHGEQGNFQILYFVSLEIMQAIYNESVLQMYKVSKRCIFQS